MELLGLLPVQRPAQLVQQISRPVAIAQRRDLGRSASRAACCPSNNTRKGGARSWIDHACARLHYYHEIRHLVNKIRTGSRPSVMLETLGLELRARKSYHAIAYRRPGKAALRRFDASTRPVSQDPVQALETPRSIVSTSAARASCPLRKSTPPRSVAQNPEQSSMRSAKRRYSRRTGRAPRSTRTDRTRTRRRLHLKRGESGLGPGCATLGSTSALRAAKVRAAGAAGSSSVAGEDGEVSLPRRARARQAFTWPTARSAGPLRPRASPASNTRAPPAPSLRRTIPDGEAALAGIMRSLAIAVRAQATQLILGTAFERIHRAQTSPW